MSWNLNIAGPPDLVKKAIEAEQHMPKFVQDFLAGWVDHVARVIEKWAETQIEKVFHVHVTSSGHVDDYNASHQSDVKPIRVAK